MAERKHKHVNSGNEKVSLVKQLTLVDCIAIVVGSIIGSGIFISPKGIIENTGTVGWALTVWVISGIFSCVGALCYAELGTTIDKSGGDYTYLRIVRPILGFLRLWTMILAVRTATITILSLTAAKYITISIYPNCDDVPVAVTQILAGCIIACIVFINCWSVWLSRKTQVIFTIAKVAGLIIIISSGIWLLITGHTENFQNAFDMEKVTWIQLPKAFYSGLFAYAGWQYLPQVTEEIVNFKRNLPLAILTSVGIVMTIYILTNIAYFVVLSPLELIASNAVAVTFGQRVLGSFWWIMPITVALSCIGSVNGVIFGSARLYFVASREGHLPTILGMIHVDKKTPLPAAVLSLPICFIMLTTNDVYALINYLSFSRWLFIAMTVATVPYFRWKYPELERPFKVPLILPIVFTFCAICMVLTSIFSAFYEFLIGFVMTLAGIPVYMLCVWYERKPEWFLSGMKNFTQFMQKLFFVIQPEEKTYSTSY